MNEEYCLMRRDAVLSSEDWACRFLRNVSNALLDYTTSQVRADYASLQSSRCEKLTFLQLRNAKLFDANPGRKVPHG